MRRICTTALLALGSACGRINFAATAGDRDASDDVATDVPRATGPFSAPTLIPELNSSASDDDPTLTADLLEICFSSARPGGAGAGDIWCATRPDTDSAWNPPTNIAVINNAQEQSTPELSADGLTMRYGEQLGVPGDIYMTTRLDRGSPWTSPALVVELTSPAYDAAAAQVNNLVLYLASERSGSRDLFRAIRASVGDPWQTPVAVVELTTAASESDPFTDDRELELYFAYQPTSSSTSRDIMLASRASTSEPFGPAVPLTELNSAMQDSDPWLSPDGRVIVFASERLGTEDLYIARR